MDLNDTPELAEYRTKVRAWLEEHAHEAPPRGDDDAESTPTASGSASSRRPASRP